MSAGMRILKSLNYSNVGTGRSGQAISRLLRIGLPIGTMIFVEGSLFIGAALLIARLGALPASAHLIAINFSALMFMVPLGLASAVTTRVGNALGRGEPEAARYAGLIGLLIVLFTQTLSAATMLIIPEFIVRIYTSDPAITSIAVGLLFYSAIFQYSDGIQICAAGALRGLKDTLVPMFINIAVLPADRLECRLLPHIQQGHGTRRYVDWHDYRSVVWCSFAVWPLPDQEQGN